MKKILKASLRDLYFHKTRSIVIIIAVIMLVSFPLAFQNTPYNLGNIINNEQDQYKLANFNLFLNNMTTYNVINDVRQIIETHSSLTNSDIIINGRMQFSSKIQSNGKGSISDGSWISTDIISIDANNLPTVNELVLTKGTFPQTNNQVVILDSLAKADGLSLGNTITIYSNVGPTNFTITGFVKTIEYSSYGLTQTGAIYPTFEGINRLIGLNNVNTKLINSIPIYFSKSLTLEQQRQLAKIIETEFNKTHKETNIILTWFVRDTSFRKSLEDALILTSRYMIVASIFIFLVSGVIIFVVMNRYINEQKTIMGAIYSYGYSRMEILLSYFTRIFILGLIGTALGLGFAKLMLSVLVGELSNIWGLFSVSTLFSINSLTTTLISAVIVTFLFTFFAVFNLLRLTPYEAMRGKTSELKNRGVLFKIATIFPFKLIRNSLKNLTRNRTRSFLTIFAFMLALMFAWSLTFTHSSIPYTIDYHYKNKVYFDLEVEIGYQTQQKTQQIVDNLLSLKSVKTLEPYINNLVPIVNRPEIFTFLMGMRRDTSMFNLNPSAISEGRWFRANSSEIVISRYVEGTLGYKINDTLNFTLLGVQFNTTIVGVTNELVDTSSILMDITYLSHFLRKYETVSNPLNLPVFNKILLKLKNGFSIKSLQDTLNKNDKDVRVALSKDFYKNRIDSLSSSQAAIIYLMVTLGLIVGAISVFTTLLIAVVEREREFALFQVFGYSKRYLFSGVVFEGLLIGTISLIPAYYLAKIVAVKLWMNIVSSSLFEMKPDFPLQVDVLIILFALISILISVVPAFFAATSKKIVEVLREE